MEQMTESIWRTKQPVLAEWLDFRSRCRLSALMGAMQRAADEHVAHMGLDHSSMLKWGMTWMLMAMELRLDRSTRFREELHLATWHKKTVGVQWYRDFEMADGRGNRVATAQTIWVLVDIARRRVLRPSALPAEVASCPHVSVGDTVARIHVPEDISLIPSHAFAVRYSGLDANGHLNNARYADLCLDALSLDELQTMEWRRFQITFHHEAVFGDEIHVLRSALEDHAEYGRGNGEGAGGIWFRGVSQNEQLLFEAFLECEVSKRPGT
jgi:acyl-ACP thioesterase